jgi:cholesterol transport system auxiliary component
MRQRAAGLLILIAGLALATGCVRIGSKPPERLLMITTAASAPAGETLSGTTGGALFVDSPAVPRSIATVRIAVRDGENSISYVKDALWADTPARQFQGMLAETVRTRAGRLVLDPGQYLARRGQMLEGNLVEFGIDAIKRQAVVTYDASLMSLDGLSVQRQRFSAFVPVATIDANSVAPAISDAANQVASAVADWLKTQQ